MSARIRRSLVIAALGMGISSLGALGVLRAETLTVAYHTPPAATAPGKTLNEGNAAPAWLNSHLQDRELEGVSGTGFEMSPDQVRPRTVGVILWDEPGTKSRGRHSNVELPASVTSIRLPDGIEFIH